VKYLTDLVRAGSARFDTGGSPKIVKRLAIGRPPPPIL